MFRLRPFLLVLAAFLLVGAGFASADEAKPSPCAARYRRIQSRELIMVARGADIQIRIRRERLEKSDLSEAEVEALQDLDRILHDPNRVVDVGDLEILQSARAIFKAESRWKRSGREDCRLDKRRFTLACALVFASTGVKGDYVHFRTAIQEVRRAIEEAAPDRNFEHTIRDFNDDPTTTIEDVRRVLDIARDRVAERLARQAKCEI